MVEVRAWVEIIPPSWMVRVLLRVAVDVGVLMTSLCIVVVVVVIVVVVSVDVSIHSIGTTT